MQLLRTAYPLPHAHLPKLSPYNFQSGSENLPKRWVPALRHLDFRIFESAVVGTMPALQKPLPPSSAHCAGSQSVGGLG